MINVDCIKSRETVIDGGINRISAGSNGKTLVRDEAYKELATKAGAHNARARRACPIDCAADGQRFHLVQCK